MSLLDMGHLKPLIDEGMMKQVTTGQFNIVYSEEVQLNETTFFKGRKPFITSRKTFSLSLFCGAKDKLNLN